MIDKATGSKYLEAAQLRELLKQVPKSTRVRVNMVGNLMLTNDAGDYIGYIDFLEGVLNLEEQ